MNLRSRLYGIIIYDGNRGWEVLLKIKIVRWNFERSEIKILEISVLKLFY